MLTKRVRFELKYISNLAFGIGGIQMKAHLRSIYVPSNNLVTRIIEGETILIPLIEGMGNTEDDLFTLNCTGNSIWQQYDGKRRLMDILKELNKEYKAPKERIKKDLIGFTTVLIKRGILKERLKK